MAKSKRIYHVTEQMAVRVPNEPSTPYLFQIDIARLLSEQLGRVVRQGHSFRLVGYGASLLPLPSVGDYDTGMAASVNLAYCPTTKWTTKAWNAMFKDWKAQKNLRGGIGGQIRYDDCEYAFEQGYIVPLVTSAIHSEGIGDTTGQEFLCLYGTSTLGADISLEQWYNERYPVPAESVDAFQGVMKKRQFGQYFPDPDVLSCSATLSAMVDSGGTPDYLGGGVAMSEIEWLPADNHLDIFCGLMDAAAYVAPEDTAGQLADEALLIVHLFIEGWTPLVRTRKRRVKTIKSRSSSSGKRRSRRKS